MAGHNQDYTMLFDRKIKRLHRKRSAILLQKNPKSRFLQEYISSNLFQRINAEMGTTFNDVLILDSGTSNLPSLLKQKVKFIVSTCSTDSLPHPAKGINQSLNIQLDEELLPFEKNSFDLVISPLALHWINDIPRCFKQIHSILKEGGMFIASILGGETLYELKQSIQKAELEVTGGISPRVSPSIDIKDAGRLLQYAAFQEPVIDSDKITVMYNDAFQLMDDLRNMGETNALIRRNKAIPPRRLMEEMAHLYKQNFGDSKGNIPATFEILTLTGWKS